MNDRLVQQQTEELERKLRAYERLIEKLPFPFMFTDYETGITIEKGAVMSNRAFRRLGSPLERKQNGSGTLTYIVMCRLKKSKRF